MPDPTNPAFESVRTVGGIEELRHRNGLTVLLVPDAAAPVVAFQVTYRVGSRNEVSGLTGATHLLEHLMFKGSERFNRDLGTSVFQTLQSVGGQINATTWYDRTNYYALLPAEHLGLAVEIEADRMRGARVRDEDLASERTVVLNELDRGENEPLRTLLHAVYATAFHAHPYGHPVIGWRSDVETVTAEGLRGLLRRRLLAAQRDRDRRRARTTATMRSTSSTGTSAPSPQVPRRATARRRSRRP